MPNLVREDINDTHAKLTLTISREDYEDKYNKELKKQQKQASIKGFRQGKAPLSYLKKMVGSSLLPKLISEEVEKQISEFNKTNETSLIDAPQFSIDSPAYDFNGVDLIDFEFHFDAFFLPNFELQGIQSSDKYEMLVCDVTDEMIEKDVNEFLRSKGESKSTTEPIKAGDLLFFEARELKDGELAEGGIETTISVLFDDIADEELKKSLIGKSVGFNTKINVFELEKDRTKEFVLRNLLGLSVEEVEDRPYELEGWFDTTIKSVERVQLPELNEEFFAEHLPNVEGLTDRASLLEYVRKESIKHHEERYSLHLLRDQFMERFLELNRPLVEVHPDLVESRLGDDLEKLSPEELEQLRKDVTFNLQQTIVLRKAAKHFDVTVVNDDIVNVLIRKFTSYFGEGATANPQILEFVSSMVKRALEDENEVRAAEIQVLVTKIFEAAKDQIGIDKKVLSEQDLLNAVDEYYNKGRGNAEELEEAEESDSAD